MKQPTPAARDTTRVFRVMLTDKPRHGGTSALSAMTVRSAQVDLQRVLKPGAWTRSCHATRELRSPVPTAAPFFPQTSGTFHPMEPVGRLAFPGPFRASIGHHWGSLGLPHDAARRSLDEDRPSP